MWVAPCSIIEKTEVRTPRTAPISCPSESAVEGTAKKWRNNSYVPSIKCTSMWSPIRFSESDVIRSGGQFGRSFPCYGPSRAEVHLPDGVAIRLGTPSSSLSASEILAVYDREIFS